MKKHPLQKLLESKGIRTFPYSSRQYGKTEFLGACCTLGSLLQAVSFASSIFDEKDLNSLVTDICGASTNSGRLFYWENIKYFRDNLL